MYATSVQKYRTTRNTLPAFVYQLACHFLRPLIYAVLVGFLMYTELSLALGLCAVRRCAHAQCEGKSLKHCENRCSPRHSNSHSPLPSRDHKHLGHRDEELVLPHRSVTCSNSTNLGLYLLFREMGPYSVNSICLFK